MKKFLKALVLALCAAFVFAACDNGSASPIYMTVLAGGTTGGGGGGATETPVTGGGSAEQAASFETDWENMEFLCINNGGVLDTKIAAPWNRKASLTLMSDSVCGDMKKNDGWEMAFSLMNEDGYPDANYFGLYNKYLGTLRIYYFCNVDVAGSGSDFAFEVILETENGNSKPFYNTLRFGIPENIAVSQNKDLLNSGVQKTFHFLLTPYSEIGQTTLRRGWHAFDIDLSAYTGNHFITNGARIQIACKTVSNSSVSLGTQISGKIDGEMNATINKEEVMAKSSGFGGALSTIAGFLGGDTSQSSLASIEASLCKGFMGSLNKYQLWAHSAFNAAAQVINFLSGEGQTPQPDKYTMNGTFDLKLNATAETNGYITAAAANNIPQVTVRKEAFNQNSSIGSGVWQITNSPVIYFISDRILTKTHSSKLDEAGQITSTNDYPDKYPALPWGTNFVVSDLTDASDPRLPYFYDPTSFELSINPQVFPDARNVKVLSYCGIYVNQASSAATAFRSFIDLTKPIFGQFFKITGFLNCPIGIYTERKFKDCTKESYAASSIKFSEDGQCLPYKSFGQANEINYYGQVAEFEKGSTFNFMIEPQNFYPYIGEWKNNTGNYREGVYREEGWWQYGYEYSCITELPELYVVVVLQFEAGSDGRKFVFSRVYLPEIKSVDLATASSIATQIEARANFRSDIQMASEYVASIKNRLQILQ